MAAEIRETELAALIGSAAAACVARDARPIVLWSEDAATVFWASEASIAIFGQANQTAGLSLSAANPGLARLRSLARELDAGATQATTLRFFVKGRLENLPTQILAVPLAGGGSGLITVFGAGEPFVLPDEPPATIEAHTPAPAPANASEAPPAPVAIASTTADARPVRFVFLTDSEGRLIRLSPSFTQATGQDGAAYIGQSLVDVLAESDPARAAEVARALFAGETWSGVTIDWPHGSSDTRHSVELSAMPVFDAARALSGYNGFGLGRRRLAPTAAAPATPAADPQPAQPTPVAVAAPPANPPAPQAVEVQPEPAPHPAAPVALAPEDAGPAPRPAAAPPRQDNVPPPEPTVVPLRTVRGHVGASLGEPKVVPLKTVTPASGDTALSPSERNAFREIARQLGARLEDDVVPAAPSAPATAEPLPVLASTPPADQEHANKVAVAQAEISKALAAAHARMEEKSGPVAGLGDALVERIPVGVLVFRGDKTIYMNRPLLDLLGYVDVAEFEALRGLDKLFRGRAAPSFSNGEYDTITIMGRDGETLPADAHLQAIDWNGQHATLVTFRRAIDAEHGPRVRSLDVELKARQAELAEARAMLDTATDGVISLDEGGRILALNKSAEALFGYDQNELAGERLTLLLAPESHAAALDYIDGLKNGGVASVLNDGREVIGRERKGGRIPLFMTIGRISETSKLAAVVRDLTAWKRAETELTEARRAAERNSALKSDFLAKVSHEIRTPMNAIIGFAEVMRDERLGPIGTERYKDYLKDIHTSGQHVISLVNDLLDLSKIEAGRMELNFGSVDLNAIVASCLGIMQPQANRDRVIMRSQLSAKLPPVVADERSIRQIILNLLSNASKFTEPGGQVIVSTMLSEQGEAIIRVRDTGVGMTEQDIQAAMEPFRQLSNARGRGGTGLGLPLTKALVEANRASFVIKSKVREGTLVEITFPATRVLAE